VLIVGGVVVEDLLVVGLDLVTGLEVHAEDRRTVEWRKKGHNGDRTLVCLACHQGAALSGGPRVVALVPKGREHGVQCQHFAHPPGMAPPGGKHHPESLWHANGKQALRRWATDQGFTARVEAWTAGGRRRSDVEIILPRGVRLAIELQFSEITDAEWIARHEDYAWARITDLWLWHPGIQVPRAVFRYDQHGWLLNLEKGQVGLIYAQPDLGVVRTASQTPGCCAVHSPPCPGDQLATLWMPLNSVRLTPHGIKLPAEITAELARMTEIFTRGLAAARQPHSAATSPDRRDQGPAIATSSDAAQKYHQRVRVHDAFRYDAFPPWTDPDTWWYRCDVCGDKLTGSELKASPVTHVVGTYERTDTGRYTVVYRCYGASTSRGQIGRLGTATLPLPVLTEVPVRRYAPFGLSAGCHAGGAPVASTPALASQWLPRSMVRILTTPCGSLRGPSVVDGLNW
jgi:hypothetical protein